MTCITLDCLYFVICVLLVPRFLGIYTLARYLANKVHIQSGTTRHECFWSHSVNESHRAYREYGDETKARRWTNKLSPTRRKVDFTCYYPYAEYLEMD